MGSKTNRHRRRRCRRRRSMVEWKEAANALFDVTYVDVAALICGIRIQIRPLMYF